MVCQEEEKRHAKEEQERKEEEEYQKLKVSFVVEEQGQVQELSEQEVIGLSFHSASTLISRRKSSIPCADAHRLYRFHRLIFSALYVFQSRNLLQEFIQYVKVQDFVIDL